MPLIVPQVPAEIRRVELFQFEANPLTTEKKHCRQQAGTSVAISKLRQDGRLLDQTHSCLMSTIDGFQLITTTNEIFPYLGVDSRGRQTVLYNKVAELRFDILGNQEPTTTIICASPNSSFSMNNGPKIQTPPYNGQSCVAFSDFHSSASFSVLFDPSNPLPVQIRRFVNTAR
jgi:hypothetical protein